ncbi:MAG: sensor histidine kinase [Acidobacteria bacterium]|nr:sensor histidine kinase [Acidobacteriota bacterium]
MRRRLGQFGSPTTGLLFGLGVTLVAATAYSAYVVVQIRSLRAFQTEVVERNRRNTLQLLRIQNDLNLLALAMRDMLDSAEPYPLTAWTAQFERVRADLAEALRLEEQLAIARRTPEQRAYLAASVTQFWDAVDRMFALARTRNDGQAREQIRLSLQARQAALSTAVARLLVENNEAERQAVDRIRGIYDRVERQVYFFLAVAQAAILLTSLYLIWSNRRMFARMATLSGQRSELAQKLIATQESTLRYIARELHDDFGQVLTAIGSILARAERQGLPAGSPLREQVREAREVAQSTLDKVRGLSQALHPVVLDEAGLETALDGYLPMIERQTGLAIAYEKEGAPFTLDGRLAIHVYRILQEALNNAARHSGAKQAWVRLRHRPGELQLEVEDRGAGFDAEGARRGIGLVAMRERAGLLGGRLEFLRPPQGGALVRLTVPLDRGEIP